MKKKAILTVAAAAAFLMANPVADKADAATIDTKVQNKVYVYQGTITDFNKILESIYHRFGISVTQMNETQPQQLQPNQTGEILQPSQPTAPTPVEQKPVTPAPLPTEQTTSTLSAYDQKVVGLTNQERAKNGLAPLKVDETLSKMAREKSRDMSANGYFSHTSPTYGSPFDMMKQYGISYRSAGENIAMGQRSPEEVVTAWMNSEGHRKNILSPNFTHIGVGHIAQGNYWTQEFIGK